MSPKFLIALTATCIAFAPGAVAQTQTGPGASGSPTPNAAKTTVKSSKSNTSDVQGQTGGDASRMGGGAGKSKDPAKGVSTTGTETERMGGGAGKSK